MTGKTILLPLLGLIGAGGIGGSLYFFREATILKEKLSELDAENRDRRQNVQALRSEIDSLREKLSDGASARRDLSTQVSSLTEEKDKLQSRIDGTKEQLAAASAKLTQATTVMSNAENELARLKQENDDLKRRLQTYTAELQLKQTKLQQVSNTHQQLVGELRREIAQSEIKITQLGDSLSVRMIGHILFPTGKAELTDEGIQVLQRVGDIIGRVEDKTIRVEGHTDDRPISYALRQVYPSNWELSTARATNVVHFLINRIGIPPERLEAVGRAQFHPVAANDTAEGRSRNRRIEILLTPPQENLEEASIRTPDAETPAADE